MRLRTSGKSISNRFINELYNDGKSNLLWNNLNFTTYYFYAIQKCRDTLLRQFPA